MNSILTPQVISSGPMALNTIYILIISKCFQMFISNIEYIYLLNVSSWFM